MDGLSIPLRVSQRLPVAKLARVAVTEAFTRTDIGDVRALVRAAGAAAAVAAGDLDDLLVAVSDIATNAIVHGGSVGSVTVEHVTTGLVVEISDSGSGLPAGLVVTRPAADAVDGRGLWLAHLMFPQIETASSPQGVTVRLTIRSDRPLTSQPTYDRAEPGPP